MSSVMPGSTGATIQASVDAGVHELANARSRAVGTGDRASSLRARRGVVGDQRDVDLKLVVLLQSQEQIAVACDQRALGDDAERKALTARQPVQHRSRDAEPTLCGLIGIGRRADDDAFAERDALEIGLERTDTCSFTKIRFSNASQPCAAAVIRELGVGQFCRHRARRSTT